MSSTADAAAVASTSTSTTTSTKQSLHSTNPDPDVIKSNQHLPARTMAADDPSDHNMSPTKDDPATMAASEELKHTSISDKIKPTSPRDQDQARDAVVEDAHASADSTMKEIVKEGTPETDLTDAQDEEMKERISSPKKKRGRDQDEDTRDQDEDNMDEPGSSADGSVVNGGRSTRSGPEKKRPRDTSEDYTNANAKEQAADVKVRPLYVLPLPTLLALIISSAGGINSRYNKPS